MSKIQRAILAERGQITIPKSLRDKLGLKPGSALTFELINGKLVLTKDVTLDPIERVRGCLPSLGSVDKLIDELRGGPV